MGGVAYILIWIILLILIGLVNFPLTYKIFRNFKDKGYLFSKVLFLFVVSYLSWILSYIFKINIFILSAVIALVIIYFNWKIFNTEKAEWAFFKGDKREIVQFFKENFRYVVICEVLFVCLFLLLLFFRAYVPQIEGSEKLADAMYMTSILNEGVMPATDAWMNGYSLNYYYFGHLIASVTMELFFTPFKYGYNLFLCAFFALVSLMIFSIVYNLISLGSIKKLSFKSELGLYLHYLFYPSLAIIIFFSSNYYSIFQVYLRGFSNFDWWPASRFIPGTINEFPMFSFILGDLHPHIIVIMLSILFFGLLFNYLNSNTSHENTKSNRQGVVFQIKKKEYFVSYSWINTILIGLVLGGIFFANKWDLPAYFMLYFFVFIIKEYGEDIKLLINHKNKSKSGERFSLRKIDYTKLLMPLCVLFVIVIFFLPFHLGVNQKVGGIGFVTHDFTSLFQYLIQFGLFIAIGYVFLMLYLIESFEFFYNKTKFWIFGLIVGIIAVLILIIIKSVLVAVLFLLLIGFGMLLYYILIEEDDKLNILGSNASNPKIYAIILFSVGLILSVAVEIVFVDDPYGGLYDRYNTVFKVYWEIWLLFTISSAYFVYSIFNDFVVRFANSTNQIFKRYGKNVVVVGFVVLVVLSYLYPVLVIPQKMAGGYKGIDGWQYLEKIYPSDYKALLWIDENLKGDEAMLTRYGDGFTVMSFISAYSGIPTLLGWRGHEDLWRSWPKEIQERVVDTDALYNGKNVAELLKKYNIKYVYIGSVERMKYPNIYTFENEGKIIYDQDNVRIIKVG